MRNIFLLCLVFSSLSVSSQTLYEDLEGVFNQYQIMGMSVWTNVEGVSEEHHFGLKDLQRNLNTDAMTHYRIASISKSFTSLGLLKLVEDGLIKLDDPISDYLSYDVLNPNEPDTDITFRMILSHQTGLQDGTGYGNFLTATFNTQPIPNLSELIVSGGSFYTNDMWNSEIPGTYFNYSNVNFGLAATMIEAISEQRFDIYMKQNILEPLNINGSYNIQDIQEINDVSVLYRFQNGNWVPQWDNYQGTYPQTPDLSAYIPGTNGLYFGPQGSLRITASDLGIFMDYLASEGSDSALEISSDILAEMTSITWDYNGSNGNNYFGLFNRWGLGVHHANVTLGDQICNLGTYGSFIGHPGEAYGLVSDAYYGETEDVAFSLLINGVQGGYQPGINSSFYTVEEAVFDVLCAYFTENLNLEDQQITSFDVYPNPASESVFIEFHQNARAGTYTLVDLYGKTLSKVSFNPAQKIMVPVKQLKTGYYFLKIATANSTQVKKIIRK